jgi:hypothetical protein
MNLVKRYVTDAMTMALIEEIQLFKKQEKTELLREELFDPSRYGSCFLAQIYGYDEQDNSARPYREKIGLAIYGLGPYHALIMTPLETWSAYMWDHDKELVMKVFRYITGKEHVLPDIRYEEIQIVGSIPATEDLE